MAQETKNKLTQLLCQRIDQQGPLTIADFMYEALQHPKYGYYNRPHVLGQKGDFVTAPEISQIFGELIGLWMLERWQSMGEPQSFSLIELGPGRGTLLCDLLRAAQLMPAFLEAADVHLVESSANLREVQRKKLADFSPTWHNDITTLPQKPSLIVANEYFDALPIRQFAKLKANKWREVLVGSNDTSELGYIMSEEIDPLQIVALGASSSSLETHDFVEVSPATSAQATLLADHLKSAGGSALFIDYGYQQAEGYNSLQAVKDHQKHDPLYEVGTADLTAHVDFEQLTRCFSQRGMNTFGPVAQGAFLSALGLEARLNNLVQNASPSEERELRSGAERLVASEKMGDLFKVLAVSSSPQTPPGFPYPNQNN